MEITNQFLAGCPAKNRPHSKAAIESYELESAPFYATSAAVIATVYRMGGDYQQLVLSEADAVRFARAAFDGIAPSERRAIVTRALSEMTDAEILECLKHSLNARVTGRLGVRMS